MKCGQEAIFIHPYIKRKNQHFVLLKNVTDQGLINAFLMFNIAEKLCVCDEEKYKMLLPVFKELYSKVGNADKEVKFIESQRKKINEVMSSN